MAQWTDHRQAVKEVLQRKGRTAYFVHKFLRRQMSMNLLHSYLRGDCGISKENAEAINNVIGLRYTDEIVPTIQIEIVGEDPWHLRASLKGEHAGSIDCADMGKHVRIGELQVQKKHRRQRVGTKLVSAVLSKAKAEGKRSVFGSIIQEDLDRTPALLEFYAKLNFRILPPDAQCVDAVHKVQWMNEAAA